MVDTYRTLGDPVDERTPTLNLPLPHRLNDSRDDVERLRQALDLIDTAQQLVELALADKAEDTDLAALALSTGNALALKASTASVEALDESLSEALAALTAAIAGKEAKKDALEIFENTVAVPGICYLIAASGVVLTLAAAYVDGQYQGARVKDGVTSCAVDFGDHKYMGRTVGVVDLDGELDRLDINYKNTDWGFR